MPLAAVNQVDPRRLDWLVPGLAGRTDGGALLKSLPKALRRNFVPVPNYARALLEVIEPGARSLVEAMTEQLQRMTGVRVPEEAWNSEAVPGHLWMRFRVVDARVWNWRSGATGKRFSGNCAARRALVPRRCPPRNSSGAAA